MKYGLFFKENDKLLEFQDLNELYKFILEAKLQANTYRIFKIEEIL